MARGFYVEGSDWAITFSFSTGWRQDGKVLWYYWRRWENGDASFWSLGLTRWLKITFGKNNQVLETV